MLDAYNNRGICYCDQRRGRPCAIVDFNKGIQLNPDYAEAYYNRSVAYRGQRSLVDLAIEDYNRAIQLKPDYADIYDNHETAWLHLEIREETRSDQTYYQRYGKKYHYPIS